MKGFFIFIFMCIALLLATLNLANAANYTLMTGFVSEHSGSKDISATTGKPYNENNYGVGLRIDHGPWYGWMVGTYRNSHDRQSMYVAKEWKSRRVGPFQLGVVAGVGTGYKSFLTPALMPEFVINMWAAELVFLAQPFSVGGNDPMIAAQVRWRLW